jgi:hypothetical protein
MGLSKKKTVSVIVPAHYSRVKNSSLITLPSDRKVLLCGGRISTASGVENIFGGECRQQWLSVSA